MDSSQVATITCPVCGTHSCETTAKSVWVRGFVIAYQISSKQVIGCVSCVRNELLKEAGVSAILGWFSITALFINPFLILWNLLQAATIGEKPEAVAKMLTELGVEPTSEGVDLLQVTYAMAASLISADGKIDPQEVQMAVEIGSRLFEDFEVEDFREVCGRADDLPAAVDLGNMVRDTLDGDQKGLLFRYMLAVSQADGNITEEEQNELVEIAAGMDFDINSLDDSSNPEDGT